MVISIKTTLVCRRVQEGNDYPLWYSYLENSMDREAWQAIYSPRTERPTLSLFHFCEFLYKMKMVYESLNLKYNLKISLYLMLNLEEKFIIC